MYLKYISTYIYNYTLYAHSINLNAYIVKICIKQKKNKIKSRDLHVCIYNRSNLIIITIKLLIYIV